MKKYLLIVFLCLFTLFTFTACSDSDDNDTSTNPPVSDNSTDDNNNNQNTPADEAETYDDIIGLYKIDCFVLGGECPSDNSMHKSEDKAWINSDSGNLLLSLYFSDLYDMMGNIFVYSEDTATLMESGFNKSVDNSGNTTVDFKLGGLAHIQMTRQEPYITLEGVGEKQESISAKINNDESITKDTKQFDVVINHKEDNDSYYKITILPDAGPDLGLPEGSHVSLGMSDTSDVDIEFTSDITTCKTDKTKTTCSVTVNNTGLEDAMSFIVVIEETDNTGNNLTGVSTLGVLNFNAIN